MNKIESKVKILPGLSIIVFLAIMLYLGMLRIEETLLESPKIYGYFELVSQMQNRIISKIFWMLGDYTEAVLYKSLPASLGLLAGSIIAHILCRKKPEFKIYSVSFGMGLLPWILFSTFIGLTISTIIYSKDVALLGWAPTFLPGCSIPAALIVMYGGGWRTTVTGGVLAGVIQFPFAKIGVFIATRLQLPPFTFITIIGMCISSIIVIEIFRILPWNRKLVKGNIAPKYNPYVKKNDIVPKLSVFWLLRRGITDLTELSFIGSEIAAIGLILGAVVSWLLNPAHICYGIPKLFPAILLTQVLSGVLCAYVYFNKWKNKGYHYTFASVIGASVCVMHIGPALPVILISVILNVLITTPVVSFGAEFMTKNIRRYPVMCGVVVCMGFCIGGISLIMRFILTAVLL